MYSKLSRGFSKKLIWSFVFVALASQSSLAASIIDMDNIRPLGTITTNVAGDETYFSLGNGRAILLEAMGRKSRNGPVVQDLLLMEAEAKSKVQPTTERKFKRNLKW